MVRVAGPPASSRSGAQPADASGSTPARCERRQDAAITDRTEPDSPPRSVAPPKNVSWALCSSCCRATRSAPASTASQGLRGGNCPSPAGECTPLLGGCNQARKRRSNPWSAGEIYGSGLSQINPTLYAIGANPAEYAADFYDVTTGNSQSDPVGTGVLGNDGLGPSDRARRAERGGARPGSRIALTGVSPGGRPHHAGPRGTGWQRACSCCGGATLSAPIVATRAHQPDRSRRPATDPADDSFVFCGRRSQRFPFGDETLCADHVHLAKVTRAWPLAQERYECQLQSDVMMWLC